MKIWQYKYFFFATDLNFLRMSISNNIQTIFWPFVVVPNTLTQFSKIFWMHCYIHSDTAAFLKLSIQHKHTYVLKWYLQEIFIFRLGHYCYLKGILNAYLLYPYYCHRITTTKMHSPSQIFIPFVFPLLFIICSLCFWTMYIYFLLLFASLYFISKTQLHSVTICHIPQFYFNTLLKMMYRKQKDVNGSFVFSLHLLQTFSQIYINIYLISVCLFYSCIVIFKCKSFPSIYGYIIVTDEAIKFRLFYTDWMFFLYNP